MHDLSHIHMLGTAKISNPPQTAEQGEAWLRELVAKVDMEILLGPYAVYCELKGNEGVTGIVCLSTSHASFHSWSEVSEPFINFDLYSCRNFDVETVLDHLSAFSPTEVSYTVIDRSIDSPKIIKSGIFKPQ